MVQFLAFLVRVNFAVVWKSFFLGSFLPSDILDVSSVLWRLSLPEETHGTQIKVLHRNLSVVCISFFMVSFLSSAIIDMFSVLWRLWLPEETHKAQIGVLHFLQYCAHICVECFEHLGVDPRISNDTITCSFDSSEICFTSHSSQRWVWQISQCLVGTEVSQRSQRMTSWRSSGKSMFNTFLAAAAKENHFKIEWYMLDNAFENISFRI